MCSGPAATSAMRLSSPPPMVRTSRLARRRLCVSNLSRRARPARRSRRLLRPFRSLSPQPAQQDLRRLLANLVVDGLPKGLLAESLELLPEPVQIGRHLRELELGSQEQAAKLEANGPARGSPMPRMAADRGIMATRMRSGVGIASDRVGPSRGHPAVEQTQRCSTSGAPG